MIGPPITLLSGLLFLMLKLFLMNLFVNEVSAVPQFLNGDSLVASGELALTSEQLQSQITTLVSIF